MSARSAAVHLVSVRRAPQKTTMMMRRNRQRGYSRGGGCANGLGQWGAAAARRTKTARFVATTTTTTTTSKEEEDQKEKSNQEDEEECDDVSPELARFNWTAQWYPLLVDNLTDKSRPQRMYLLGVQLVMWHDGKDWHAAEDVCPHRLAPMSEGRVEADGTLMCSYHGWRFDGDGKVLDIPQATSEEMERARQNERSCLRGVRPVQTIHNVVWVWGERDGDADAFLRASNTPAKTFDELLTTTGHADGWSMRDLPYGWEYFMENVSDSSHVPVSHHGIVGNRDDAKPFRWIEDKEACDPDKNFDLKFKIDPPGAVEAENVEASHHFLPPCLMRIETVKSGGGKSLLALYCTPTKPGHSRLIGTTVTCPNDDGTMPGGFGPMAKMASIVPTFFMHIFGTAFINQDGVFLHHQEQNMAEQYRLRGEDWHKSCYLPTKVDKMNVAFRRWMDKHGAKSEDVGSRVPYEPEAPPLPPRMSDEELFDVYNSHTKNCTACSAASKNLAKARITFYIASAALAIAGAAVWAVAASSSPHSAASAFYKKCTFGSVLWIFSALSAFIGTVAANLREKLHYFPYSHQDNN
eukprot:CAMPEP_0205950212 /NCGR_PEP_ID=MMETSP1459-20131121/2166_1 /ASSEMBLY_ACC=CAM_ASM_001120 /TAXON_ID=41880 /ORGANISM="Pycnococcus provasolii, Strain RCC931" /LENGTH=578 /DNA_ID=CAMNT_0053321851 /DNA_START=44 /DNA_END=1780 /DNA_ORIENTATION=+